MLSPEKVELFKKLWLSGVKTEEIARILGIRPNDVSIYAKVLGLPRRSKTIPPQKKISDEDVELIKIMWEEGATIREIAEYFGVSESTILTYLRAMGLKRRNRRKCPSIPYDELLELCLKGYTDREIAERYNTTVDCVARLRRRYGINKRMIKMERHRRELEEQVYRILEILEKKGFTTSRELKEKYGINLSKELLNILRDNVEGVDFFRMTRVSSHEYSVFSPHLTGCIVIYLEGYEDDVAEFLSSHLINRDAPFKAVRAVLKNNNVPERVIIAIRRYVE